MGGSFTGETFSAIHRDLVTELFKKETKGTAGPFRCGFSTDIGSVNTWINRIHRYWVARDMLEAPKIGMTQFKAFVEERLIKGKVNFFD